MIGKFTKIIKNKEVIEKYPIVSMIGIIYIVFNPKNHSFFGVKKGWRTPIYKSSNDLIESLKSVCWHMWRYDVVEINNGCVFDINKLPKLTFDAHIHYDYTDCHWNSKVVYQSDVFDVNLRNSNDFKKTVKEQIKEYVIINELYWDFNVRKTTINFITLKTNINFIT
jgi:hypothetical protein